MIEDNHRCVHIFFERMILMKNGVKVFVTFSLTLCLLLSFFPLNALAACTHPNRTIIDRWVDCTYVGSKTICFWGVSYEHIECDDCHYAYWVTSDKPIPFGHSYIVFMYYEPAKDRSFFMCEDCGYSFYVPGYVTIYSTPLEYD